MKSIKIGYAEVINDHVVRFFPSSTIPRKNTMGIFMEVYQNGHVDLDVYNILETVYTLSEKKDHVEVSYKTEMKNTEEAKKKNLQSVVATAMDLKKRLLSSSMSLIDTENSFKRLLSSKSLDSLSPFELQYLRTEVAARGRNESESELLAKWKSKSEEGATRNNKIIGLFNQVDDLVKDTSLQFDEKAEEIKLVVEAIYEASQETN